MKCSNCGEELSARAPYCGLCGTYAPGYEDWGDREVSGGPENNFSANNYHAEYFDENSAYNDWESNNARGLAIPGDERDTHRPRQSEIYADPDAELRAQGKYEIAVIALLGNNADDYLERFQSDSIFNIWGFLFGPSWYAYRGMLGTALKLLLLYYIPCVGQLIGFYFQCTADRHYQKYIDTHAKKLAQFEEGSQEWNEYVHAHGRTSIGSLFIFWAIAFGLYFALRLLVELLA